MYVCRVFTFVLTDGGTADLFWGFIVLTFGMLLVYASLAEMASMSPTAGGQYHWVKRILSETLKETTLTDIAGIRVCTSTVSEAS